jgi:hypothetical protein
MKQAEHKDFGTPDEVREFPKGRLELIKVGGAMVGRAVFEPGWKWSNDVRPIAGTTHCEHRHLGIVISGQLHVVMNDGATMDFVPGDIYEIPPGHDAWVVGDDP